MMMSSRLRMSLKHEKEGVLQRLVTSAFKQQLQTPLLDAVADDEACGQFYNIDSHKGLSSFKELSPDDDASECSLDHPRESVVGKKDGYQSEATDDAGSRVDTQSTTGDDGSLGSAGWGDSALFKNKHDQYHFPMKGSYHYASPNRGDTRSVVSNTDMDVSQFRATVVKRLDATKKLVQALQDDSNGCQTKEVLKLASKLKKLTESLEWMDEHMASTARKRAKAKPISPIQKSKKMKSPQRNIPKVNSPPCSPAKLKNASHPSKPVQTKNTPTPHSPRHRRATKTPHSPLRKSLKFYSL